MFYFAYYSKQCIKVVLNNFIVQQIVIQVQYDMSSKCRRSKSASRLMIHDYEYFSVSWTTSNE